MKNCLICGNYFNNNVNYTFQYFDKNFNLPVSEWTYGYTENSWLTEEDAVYKAEALIFSRNSVKNIKVKQLLGNEWIDIDLEKSPFAYHNKKAPT